MNINDGKIEKLVTTTLEQSQIVSPSADFEKRLFERSKILLRTRHRKHSANSFFSLLSQLKWNIGFVLTVGVIIISLPLSFFITTISESGSEKHYNLNTSREIEFAVVDIDKLISEVDSLNFNDPEISDL